MKPILQTDRLILRKICKKDLPDLLRLHSDPVVQKYTGQEPVRSLLEIEEGMKENVLKDYQKYGFGRWAVILSSSGQFTGWAGLKYLPEFKEVDLGYRLLPEFWNKGIATEASMAILNYGFETLELKKIIAIAMVENIASIRVMEKVGMTLYKKAPYEEGTPDDLWYKIENP